MKPLEELGISTTPWKMIYDDTIDRVVNILDANNKVIVKTDYGYYPPELPDAHLIAAAPKLYKAVYELLEIVCDDCQSRVVPISENRCTVCPRVQRARAALAEAAGESGVSK